MNSTTKVAGLIGLACLAVAMIIGYLQFTLFVIHPMGAIPEGKTVLLWRRSAVLNFVDSPDAVCDRIQNGVSLLCRAITLAKVVEVNPILVRLPYSSDAVF